MTLGCRRPRRPETSQHERIRIAVTEFVHVGRGERKTVKKGTPLLVGGIGIVDRKHHAVDAERQQRRNEWRLGE
jgi:hypothetical protein